MFIASNRLSVADGRQDEFEEFFTYNMRTFLPGVPGMRRSILYRPLDPGQAYLSLNEFETEARFKDWLASDSFRQSHEHVRRRNLGYLSVDGMEREHLEPVTEAIVRPAVEERARTVFTATSRIFVHPDRVADFEPFYGEHLRTDLPGVPGLLRSTLYRRAAGHVYLALEEFETEARYRAWQESPAFRASHEPVRRRITPLITDYRREYYRPLVDLAL